MRGRLVTGEAFGLTPQYACDDCQPETRLDDLGGNVYVLRVYHDDSCPNFARITAGGEA